MATVARPEFVNVLSRTFSVHFLDEKEWSKEHEADGDQGYLDLVADRILIRTYEGRANGEPASEAGLRQTMMHELLHCCIDAANMNQPVKFWEGKDDDDAEEWMAACLTPPLLAVLRSNMDLVKWLVK